jgi:hypothetical protein
MTLVADADHVIPGTLGASRRTLLRQLTDRLVHEHRDALSPGLVIAVVSRTGHAFRRAPVDDPSTWVGLCETAARQLLDRRRSGPVETL